MVNYLPADIPEYQQPPDIQQDFNHPLEKREAAFFDPEPSYEYILPEVDTDDFLMTSLVPGTGGDVIIQTEDGFNQDEDRQQPDMTSRDRRTETFPAGSQDDISNYDFEYEDSDGDNQDDDILYYNSDIEPIAVESVFNRMERLDVKKPGPFYSNSPNNFYLDKVSSCEKLILSNYFPLKSFCQTTPNQLRTSMKVNNKKNRPVDSNISLKIRVRRNMNILSSPRKRAATRKDSRSLYWAILSRTQRTMATSVLTPKRGQNEWRRWNDLGIYNNF